MNLLSGDDFYVLKKEKDRLNLSFSFNMTMGYAHQNLNSIINATTRA